MMGRPAKTKMRPSRRAATAAKLRRPWAETMPCEREGERVEREEKREKDEHVPTQDPTQEAAPLSNDSATSPYRRARKQKSLCEWATQRGEEGYETKKGENPSRLTRKGGKGVYAW
jgi:hypothetical protein